MKGRGQIGAAKDALPSGVAEYGDVQVRRDMGVVEDSQLLQEADIGRAAAQEDVLAVIYLPARVGIRKGERPPAKEGTLLHEDNRVAAVSQVAGGRHPRQPAADNDYFPAALAANPFTHSLAPSQLFPRAKTYPIAEHLVPGSLAVRRRLFPGQALGDSPPPDVPQEPHVGQLHGKTQVPQDVGQLHASPSQPRAPWRRGPCTRISRCR